MNQLTPKQSQFLARMNTRFAEARSIDQTSRDGNPVANKVLFGNTKANFNDESLIESYQYQGGINFQDRVELSTDGDIVTVYEKKHHFFAPDQVQHEVRAKYNRRTEEFVEFQSN